MSACALSLSQFLSNLSYSPTLALILMSARMRGESTSVLIHDSQSFRKKADGLYWQLTTPKKNTGILVIYYYFSQCLENVHSFFLRRGLSIWQCLEHRPGFQHENAAAPVVSFCTLIYYLSSWHRCLNPNSNARF